LTLGARCRRCSLSRAQDFHGALKKALELARFNAYTRRNSLKGILRRGKIGFERLDYVVGQIHG
jgi:hypothetical protein